MLELFFDSSGIVHMEFIPKEVTVNKHRYQEILHHLCNPICHKHPELWHRKNWLLLHDISLHIALSLSKRSWKNNRSPFCHILHTHLISHHEISSPTPAWKKSYVGIDFSRLRRSSLSQGKLYMTFLQISFSSVSSSYTNIGRLAQWLTATILKDVDMCIL
jgi:hypothetical protein